MGAGGGRHLAQSAIKLHSSQAAIKITEHKIEVRVPNAELP